MRIVLSPAQQRVIDHRGAPLQVIACAGSGKTESISRRVAALIGEGATPESIVAFTFTERATAELKDRIVRRVAERMGDDFKDRLGPMFVGTIHGYCFRLLQDHVLRFGNYDVLDPHRHAGFLAREFRALGLSKLGNKKWVAAVNNAKRYGEWAFEICRDLTELRGMLAKHAGQVAEVLPFQFVEPHSKERFRSCVPLVSLKAAAGSWSTEQASLDLWTTIQVKKLFCPSLAEIHLAMLRDSTILRRKS